MYIITFNSEKNDYKPSIIRWICLVWFRFYGV